MKTDAIERERRYVSEFCLFPILLPFICKMKKSIWMFHECWCSASAWIYQISNYLHHTKERERLNESGMGKYSLSGEIKERKLAITWRLKRTRDALACHEDGTRRIIGECIDVKKGISSCIGHVQCKQYSFEERLHRKWKHVDQNNENLLLVLVLGPVLVLIFALSVRYNSHSPWLEYNLVKIKPKYAPSHAMTTSP